MNTNTGEIGPFKTIQRNAETGQEILAINLKDLSKHTQELIKKDGRAFITRNSRCPCGSGKRFKNCHMRK